MKPLVSILIPAYNAEKWIGNTLEAAIAQSWPRKEIIVVDDGSSDRTPEVARRYASKELAVVSVQNQGAAAARNHALKLSQGDYIQWLDADDLLATDKIERQLAASGEAAGSRVLFSSQWAPFYYRPRSARFVDTYLCQDLSPVDWLVGKLSMNLHMQTGTWLTSRELAEAAGPWDTRLLSDDDGEYFCRVLLASAGTHFVSGTGVYYRVTGGDRLSSVRSDRKKDAMLISMKLHIQYLRSLEDSDRVKKSCLTYLQNWYGAFYPDRLDAIMELQGMAAQLGGHLKPPSLSWKFNWMHQVFGWKVAKRTHGCLSTLKESCLRHVDGLMLGLETSKASARAVIDPLRGPAK
jgi:glycosyltransferase involved in cell wall biosynthesis